MKNNKQLIRNILTTASTLAVAFGAADAYAAGNHVTLNAPAVAPGAAPAATTDVDLVERTAAMNGAVAGNSIKLNENNTKLKVVANTVRNNIGAIKGIDVADKNDSILEAGAQDFNLGVVVSSTDPAVHKLNIDFTGANILALNGKIAGNIRATRAAGVGAANAVQNDYSALGNINFKGNNATLGLNLNGGAASPEIKGNIDNTLGVGGKLRIVQTGNTDLIFSGNIGQNNALSEIKIVNQKEAIFSGNVVQAQDIIIGGANGGKITFGNTTAAGTVVTSANGIDGSAAANLGNSNDIIIQDKATLDAAIGANINQIIVKNNSELTMKKAWNNAVIINPENANNGLLILDNINTSSDIGAANKFANVRLDNLNGGAAATNLAHDINADALRLAGGTKLKIDGKIKVGLVTADNASQLVVDAPAPAAAPGAAPVLPDVALNFNVGKAAGAANPAEFVNIDFAGNNKVIVADGKSIYASLSKSGRNFGDIKLHGAGAKLYLADNSEVGMVSGTGELHTTGSAKITKNISSQFFMDGAGTVEIDIAQISGAVEQRNNATLKLLKDVAFAGNYKVNRGTIDLNGQDLSFNGAAELQNSTVDLGLKTLAFAVNVAFKGNNIVNLDLNGANHGKITSVNVIDLTNINTGGGEKITVKVNVMGVPADGAVINFIETKAITGTGDDAKIQFVFAGNPLGMNYAADGNVGTLKFTAVPAAAPAPAPAPAGGAPVHAAAPAPAPAPAPAGGAPVAAPAPAPAAGGAPVHVAAAPEIAAANEANKKVAAHAKAEKFKNVGYLVSEMAKFSELDSKHKNAKTQEEHKSAVHEYKERATKILQEAKKSDQEAQKNALSIINEQFKQIVQESRVLKKAEKLDAEKSHKLEGFLGAISQESKAAPEIVKRIISNTTNDEKINIAAIIQTSEKAQKREEAQHKAIGANVAAHSGAAAHAAIDTVAARTAAVTIPVSAPAISPSSVPSAPGASGSMAPATADLQAYGEGIAAGSSTQKHGVWGQIMGGIASQKARKGASGFKSNLIGSMIGADTMLDDNATIGIAFGMVANNTKMKDIQLGDKTRSTSLIGSLYGNYAFDNAFFVRGSVAYINSAVKNVDSRDVAVGITGIAKAKYHINSFAGELAFGKVVAMNNFTLVPSIGARVTHTNKISYQEKGNTGLNNKVSQRAMSSVYGIAGLQVAKPFDNGGVFVTPEAHANLQYGLGVKTPKGKFTSEVDQKAVSYVGNKPSRLSGNLGAGITADTGMIEYGVGYDAQIAAGYLGHQGTLKLKVKF